MMDYNEGIMAFRVFTAYGAASRPEATLRTSGYLFLSKGILQRGGDEGATHCQLQFDEQSGLLGIKLASNGEELLEDGFRPLTVERSGASINILPLLRYYGFPRIKEKRVLPVKFEDGLIVIELGNEFQKPVPQKPRKSVTEQVTQEEFDDDIPF
jgi:hypothetical protein